MGDRDFISTISRGRLNMHFQSNTCQWSLRAVSHQILPRPQEHQRKELLFPPSPAMFLPYYFPFPFSCFSWPENNRACSRCCPHWKLVFDPGTRWSNSILQLQKLWAQWTQQEDIRVKGQIKEQKYLFCWQPEITSHKESMQQHPYFCKALLGSWGINNRNSSQGWFHPWWGNWTKDLTSISFLI